MERAKRVNPLGYIHKPFSEQQIKAVIEMGLYRKDQEDKITKRYKELSLLTEKQSKQLGWTATLLDLKFEDVKDLDAAIGCVMAHLNQDRSRLEADTISNISRLIYSLLEKFKRQEQEITKNAVFSAVEAILGNAIAPVLHRLPPEYQALTLAELRVAILVKEGNTSKEIAETLNLAPSTVTWHRKRIRKKLGIDKTREEIVDHLSPVG